LIIEILRCRLSFAIPVKPRAATQRSSSPAAGSRSEAEERGEAQAVGGRVQRLVVPLLSDLGSRLVEAANDFGNVSEVSDVPVLSALILAGFRAEAAAQKMIQQCRSFTCGADAVTVEPGRYPKAATPAAITHNSVPLAFVELQIKHWTLPNR